MLLRFCSWIYCSFIDSIFNFSDLITCSHLCNKNETCTAFTLDPASKCSVVSGTQNLVKTSSKNPEALRLGIANYKNLPLVPHFLILHESNKLEDYSLDPVISPSIDYGSWPIETFPPVTSPDIRSMASVLMSDMTLNIRQYEKGLTYGNNYFHWNFEKDSDPVAFSTIPDVIGFFYTATAATGFGKIYIHSGKQPPGKNMYKKFFKGPFLSFKANFIYSANFL